MVHAFLSRRLRAFILVLLSFSLFICMLEVFSSGMPKISSVTIYLPTLGVEPFVLQHEDVGEVVLQSDHSTSTKGHLRAHTMTKRPVRTSNIQRMTRTEVLRPSTAAVKATQQKSSSTISSTSTKRPISTSVRSTTLISATPTEGAIVAAVDRNASLEWLPEIQNPMWTLHRYNHDDPSPPSRVSTPLDKGNEAMPYLSYIINNYASLPDYSIFIHGHRTAWHQQGDIVNIINNLRFDALDAEGYVSLRCDWYPSCPRELRPLDRDAIVWGPGVWRNETEDAIADNWVALFGADVPIPRTIASQCCAQFAVSREAILRHPKSTYLRMRQWLVDTSLRSEVSGRVFEKLWAYIFTGRGVNCPPPQVCACRFFGQCGWVDWTIPPAGLGRWRSEFDGPRRPTVQSEESDEAR